jgi:hypothetical protein
MDNIAYLKGYIKDSQIYLGCFPIVLSGAINCPLTEDIQAEKLRKQIILAEEPDPLYIRLTQNLISLDSTEENIVGLTTMSEEPILYF